MKSPVAVTLIIMGALLIMTPALADCLYARNLAAVMTRPEIASVNLEGKMSTLYRIGCWLAGSVMIGVAVLASAPPVNEAPGRRLRPPRHHENYQDTA
jgi:hypothetical protein